MKFFKFLWVLLGLWFVSPALQAQELVLSSLVKEIASKGQIPLWSQKQARSEMQVGLWMSKNMLFKFFIRF